MIVNLGSQQVITQIAVNHVSKIDHCGATWQRHDLALGCEHINGIGEQINFDMVPKFRGIACFFLDVQQRLQPLRAQAFGFHTAAGFVLVQPVRCNTRLSHHIHAFCAHLELNIDA